MFFGPFELKVSKVAERLDLTMLPSTERDILCYGINYSPGTHDAYRFFIMPEYKMEEPDDARAKKWGWKLKRRSYSSADRVLVRTAAGSEEIQLLGIHPTTQTVAGMQSFDFEGEAILDIGIPKVFKLKVSGKVKSSIKKSSYSVYASRTDREAQWIFLEPWIERGASFTLEFLCLVPKTVEEPSRFIRCDVKVEDRGRTLKKVYDRKIIIPAGTPPVSVSASSAPA
jgi:hypothetical protein